MSSARDVTTPAIGHIGPALATRRPANAVRRDGLEPLLSASEELLASETLDTLLRCSIEVLRDTVGLVRASIFLADDSRDFMLGTWGLDSSGAIVDEHHFVHEMSSTDLRTVLADEELAQYTVFGECLIVEHRRRGTSVRDQGWVACTPIRYGATAIGMMLNYAGASQAPLDQAKQIQAAMLCRVLGTAFGSLATAKPLRAHRMLMGAVALLLRDPCIGRQEIARQLGIKSRRLTRMFESDLGILLSEYRDRLRLDRFAFLIANGGTSLSDAAIAAGFKSYAHCQQVSRTFRWMSYLKRLTR